MKSRIGELVVQIISVMIGVFLGLIVSNWSEEKKEKVKSEQLLQNIASEISLNKERLSHVIGYHRMLKDSTRFYLDNKSFTNFKPDFFKGVNTLSLYNSAYETGVQTGLFNGLSLNQLQLINEAYTFQRSYEEFANLLLSGLINLDFDDTEQSTRRILTFLSISMTDVVIKEEQLLESYDEVLLTIK